MGLPLAARQALVGKRMTFSLLRWLKGATTTPQMWQLIIYAHKAVQRKPEPSRANKSGMAKDNCGQKRHSNSAGRTDKSYREAGKQQGPPVGFRQRIPRPPSSPGIPQH